VWHAKALELFPAETVRLGECYASYRELVRDDNAEHAALLLPLHHLSCRYKMNRPTYYFECLVLALEWDRATNSFRWVLLRGLAHESNVLRRSACADQQLHPASLPLQAVHRCPRRGGPAPAISEQPGVPGAPRHSVRPGTAAAEPGGGQGEVRVRLRSATTLLLMHLLPCARSATSPPLALPTARARELQLRLAGMQGLGSLPAVLAVQHEVALCERRASQLAAELSRLPELAFADLLTVVRPAGQQLVVDRPGHKLVGAVPPAGSSAAPPESHPSPGRAHSCRLGPPSCPSTELPLALPPPTPLAPCASCKNTPYAHVHCPPPPQAGLPGV
jgi:hypothetical protein